MAYSQKQIQDAALREATMVGGDANASPVIDNAVALEDLFYLALRAAVLEGAAIETENGGLQRDYSIVIASGTGPLPDTVLDECLDTSSVYSTTDADITTLTSYQSRHLDYLRPVHVQLGYYTVLGGNLLFREPGGATGSYGGTIHLVTVGTPDIPAVATNPIEIATETAERCIAILARMVGGGDA